MKVSLVMPVYNEERTLPAILQRLFDVGVADELVIVDDGSEDRSVDIIKNTPIPNNLKLRLIEQPENRGKGAALRAGFEQVSGEIIGIQDADEEYFPEDIPELIEPIRNGRTKIVYGCRSFSGHQSYSYFYYLGNAFLTLMTNVLYNIHISDVETCYKFFHREVFDQITLQSDSFTIENELTARIVRAGYNIYEVPIRYVARSREEGKKITTWDGVKAAGALLYYRIF